MDKQKAKEILEQKIENGRASAFHLFEKIQAEAPKDSIVKGSALNFEVIGTVHGVGLGFGQPGINAIHKHALAQLATRASIPTSYMNELATSGEGWKENLAAMILNRHYHEGETNSRYLVRRVNGEVRGFLSDKYRRLDCRPLLDAFAKECHSVGAVPVDGTVSDVRVAMKAIIPTVYEPVPGEALAFGIEWSNSDYGAAMHAVRAFILRVWCLNGATMENALGQVHLGRQLTDDIELSQRTYDLDTKASVSALRDVVQGTLSEKKIEMLCEGIRQADAHKVEWRNVSTKLGKRLLKGELDAAREAFDGPDVYNLPAGKSVWRASNALSWIAGNTEDPDRKLELQRFAGEILHGRSEALAA